VDFYYKYAIVKAAKQVHYRYEDTVARKRGCW